MGYDGTATSKPHDLVGEGGEGSTAVLRTLSRSTCPRCGRMKWRLHGGCQAFMSLHLCAMRPKIHNATAATMPIAANGIHTCVCGW